MLAILCFYLFWANFDLKFGILAKSYVGYTHPDIKKRLGVEFPEGLFFRERLSIYTKIML